MAEILLRRLVFQCCSQSSLSRAVFHTLVIKSTLFPKRFIRPWNSWVFFIWIKHSAGLWGEQKPSSQCFPEGLTVHGQGVKQESWTLGPWCRVTTARPDMSRWSVWALLPLQSFCGRAGSDGDIWTCKSAWCEVPRSSQPSEVGFSEAVFSRENIRKMIFLK